MNLATRLKRRGLGNYFVVGLMIMLFSLVAEILVAVLFIIPATAALLIGSFEAGMILAVVGLIATIPALGYVVVKLGGE